MERNTAGSLWYGKVKYVVFVSLSFLFLNRPFWGGGVGGDGIRTGGLAMVKWY